jgi:cytochrome c biogenesis protein CcmG/thiol:disulfide interchange protein DsbE
VVSGSRRTWIAWTALLLPVLALLSLLAAGTIRHQRTLQIGAALARGDAPLVPAVTLPAFDGPGLPLTTLHGHPVVLNFWASWGVIVLGVDTQDLVAPARGFLARYGITYRNVRDPDGSVSRLFGATGVPETFFIGADGRIRGKFPGEQVDPAAWRAAVKALLAGQARVP